MKNQDNKKKLTLNKETIRNLSDDKLGQVAGGDGNGSLLLLCSLIAVCGDSALLGNCSFVCGGGK
ncbi:class I lanthipeptide [Cystobacter ferrugineus]|uniref:Uncharacterized protein n=1 Tax=Cystobacter ferrugineus TaxID=83449 RepID=A0A1L9B651_9BACT|nr:class I lanthipeptide [Cystobacter ferrugineus]OJH37749.1 hypothetical protein BON30_26560 [Cystobacter ferrugineus]